MAANPRAKLTSASGMCSPHARARRNAWRYFRHARFCCDRDHRWESEYNARDSPTRIRLIAKSSASRVTGFPFVPSSHDAPMSTGTPRASLVSSRPPIRSRASRTITDRPRRCSTRAAMRPAAPAPMTITSAAVPVARVAVAARGDNMTCPLPAATANDPSPTTCSNRLRLSAGCCEGTRSSSPSPTRSTTRSQRDHPAIPRSSPRDPPGSPPSDPGGSRGPAGTVSGLRPGHGLEGSADG